MLQEKTVLLRREEAIQRYGEWKEKKVGRSILMDLQCVGASHTSCIAQSSRTEWFNKIFGKFPACVISSFLVLAFYIW